MRFKYRTKDTCSAEIHFNISDGIVTDIEFIGGCNGNLKAISTLVEGMTADEIAKKLAGNTCGRRPTSCADQLAKAVLAAREQEQK